MIATPKQNFNERHNMKHLTIILIMAIAFCGCQTLQTPEGRLDRERVIRALDTGELFFNMGLNFAKVRGADPLQVERIRVTSSIAFDLVRDALAVNLRDTKHAKDTSPLLQVRSGPYSCHSLEPWATIARRLLW